MRVIFVCTGNTCRSPMAEGYLKSVLPNIKVESRGLCASGEAVSVNSAAVCAERGIDISGHISRQFVADDLSADKIICMSASHRAALIGAGDDSGRVSVLGNGISDPFGGDIQIYRACRDEIFSAIDVLLSEGFFSDIKILHLEHRHICDIARLEAECFSEPWSENAIAESYAAGTKFFVAEKCGALAGYIGISAVCGEGYITNVAVFPEFRRAGIATLLLKKVFSFARESALEFVSLEVRESNLPAISLYEKLGFKREGLRKSFYRNPAESAIIMTRRFTSDEDTEH